MGWLWFLAGAIAGIVFGIMVTCAIVMDRKLEEWEEK